jgi:UrcA family protein
LQNPPTVTAHFVYESADSSPKSVDSARHLDMVKNMSSWRPMRRQYGRKKKNRVRRTKAMILDLTMRAGVSATLLSATALTMMMATPVACAQDVTGSPVHQRGAKVRITPMRTAYGAPIGDVSALGVVGRSDLDLRTEHGAKELRARVKRAAQATCTDIDEIYPISADGSPNCYETALSSGMESARIAIQNAREAAAR